MAISALHLQNKKGYIMLSFIKNRSIRDKILFIAIGGISFAVISMFIMWYESNKSVENFLSINLML